MKKPWPRRRTYPVLGLALASAVPAGFAGLRSLIAARAPTLEWLGEELSSQAAAYTYMACATALAFVVLGWILGRKEDLLESCSTTDALTGLANRRFLHARLVAELSRSARCGTPSALLLIDVDDLKAINDRHGHEAGDAALQAVSEALRRSCRKTDLPARYGGDEFLVLASSTTALQALVLADRLRVVLRATAAGLQAPVTVSIGVADDECAGSLQEEALYAAADLALYRAKALGRDRVVLAPAPPVPLIAGITRKEKRNDHAQPHACARRDIGVGG